MAFHQHICWVPREWLSFPWDSLQVVLHKEIITHCYKHRTLEGAAIRIEYITAYLQYHDQHLWMCKNHDKRKAPHFKEYYAFFIPCLYCVSLNLLRHK